MAAKEVSKLLPPQSFTRFNPPYSTRKVTRNGTNHSQLCEKLNIKVAEALFIFDCNGVPGYPETVNKNLGELKRYTMITLSPENIGAPIN